LILDAHGIESLGFAFFDLQISRSDPVETEQAVLRLPPFP
jgi:hypothetical protein